MVAPIVLVIGTAIVTTAANMIFSKPKDEVGEILNEIWPTAEMRATSLGDIYASVPIGSTLPDGSDLAAKALEQMQITMAKDGIEPIQREIFVQNAILKRQETLQAAGLEIASTQTPEATSRQFSQGASKKQLSPEAQLAQVLSTGEQGPPGGTRATPQGVVSGQGQGPILEQTFNAKGKPSKSRVLPSGGKSEPLETPAAELETAAENPNLSAAVQGSSLSMTPLPLNFTPANFTPLTEQDIRRIRLRLGT